MVNEITDEDWFELNVAGGGRGAIAIPALPSDAVQRRFTGRAGRENLEQAFEFYKLVTERLPSIKGNGQRILDFGGGWARIIRFFLREIPAHQLVLADCLSDAIECARQLKPPYRVVKTDICPPLPFSPASFTACYAFSVFSHLNEEMCRAWIKHLGELLVAGGVLVITTRGRSHIRSLENLRQQAKMTMLRRLKNMIASPSNTDSHITALVKIARAARNREAVRQSSILPHGRWRRTD
jgi:ubiquinone/menaquinone biosynthesis C-methylase UbiE